MLSGDHDGDLGSSGLKQEGGGLSGFNYIVTAQKPTAVNLVCTGHFTSEHELSVIVCKMHRIEIHKVTTEGLTPVLEFPVYGGVEVMELFRPANEDKDLLFLLTDSFQFCVLHYNEKEKQIETRAYGDATDRVGKPAEQGVIGHIDPLNRMIGLRIYHGVYKVIPIDSATGRLRDGFNVRLEETNVLDMVFLHGYAKPTVAVLYEDTRETRHIKTYEVLIKDKELPPGPWTQGNVEGAANILIPVPQPYMGVIVLGEHTITYVNGEAPVAIAMDNTIMTSYEQIDKQGLRYLLADYVGNMYILVLTVRDNKVVGLELNWLGETSTASCLSYLDNRVVYVGSKYGDSQLVRLNADKDPETGSCIEVLENYTNLGPIVDFCVVDYERQGQGQLVTCSGTGKDGTLRIVRNGIGINPLATLDMSGVKGIWALGANSMGGGDSMLCMSFVGSTTFLLLEQDGELEMIDVPGFVADTPTIYCGSVVDDGMLQVTPRGVRLASASTRQLLSEWTVPGDRSVTVAACNGTDLLLGIGGHHIAYLTVAGGTVREVAVRAMPHEVACVALLPPTEGQSNSGTCAVGLWDISVHVLDLSTMQPITIEHLGGEILPRSLLMLPMEGVDYLLVALGDGSLLHFVYANRRLSERKKLSLGTQPLELTAFRSRDSTCVFAASDRPTVIYSSHRKLVYSNVNVKEVQHMCAFDSAAYPDSLALVSVDTVTIGTIDEIQKLHIRTIPLGEQPRRIAFMEDTNTFGVITMRTVVMEGEAKQAHYLRLFDNQTFEVLDSYQLEADEEGSALLCMRFQDSDKTYFVLGSAYVLPGEDEPTRGRILVLEVTEGSGSVGPKLQLVSSNEVRGAVYSMSDLGGRLVAGINSKINIFRWQEKTEGAERGWELFPECGQHGLIVALFVKSRGDFMLVGDLMKSMSLYVYKQLGSTIERLAQDVPSKWMTAVEILDDDLFLGAENMGNIFTLKKNSEIASDEDRERLEMVGAFHTGEFINAFRHGSLVMRVQEDNPNTIHPSIIYGSISGAIGVLANLTEEQHHFLSDVQTRLTKVIKGVGGFSHSNWRKFRNMQKETDSYGFIDGDLIESALDLSPAQLEEVVKGLTIPDKEARAHGGGQADRPVTVSDLVKYIEELSRVH